MAENDGQAAVMGRDLHAFLEIKKDYTTWFNRMTEYGFEQEIDYTPKIGSVLSEARNRTYEKTDHILSLDMAKEVAMIQRTEKGKQARQYFIEIEKAYKESDRRSQALPASFIEALEALVSAKKGNPGTVRR